VVPRYRGIARLQVSWSPYLQPWLEVGPNPLSGPSTFTYSIAWLAGIAALNPIQTAGALSRFFGLGPLSRPFGIGLYFLDVATIGVIQNCATTLGEEIGWRGFLVPELAKRFSFTATAVLSGAIWALWHVPIIVLPATTWEPAGLVWPLSPPT
jgi:membrane protease YdiL (CAAX protease family)